MKTYLLLLLLILVHFFSFAQQIQKMNVGELNAYIAKSEKPLVVSFWATWCGSCVEEIPYFISTVKDKFRGDVELLLVSLDIKSYFPKKIESFAVKKNFDVPIVWLNEPNADVFCPLIDPAWSGAIPSTLMINNKKQYRKFYEVGMSPLQFERNVRQLLAVSGGMSR